MSLKLFVSIDFFYIDPRIYCNLLNYLLVALHSFTIIHNSVIYICWYELFCLHLLSISLVERTIIINTGSKGKDLFFCLFT